MEIESNSPKWSGGGSAVPADLMTRNRAEIRLLDEWLADESGYDEETWPMLRAALQANRRTEAL